MRWGNRRHEANLTLPVTGATGPSRSLRKRAERAKTELTADSAQMTQLILFNLFNGLIIGAFYALMALGLSLILNLSGVINFAHGGFLAIGAYLAYMLIPYIGFWGALAVAPILTAVLGLIVERVLIRPLYGRDPFYSLLLTFGLAFMLEDGTRYIWGPGHVAVLDPGLAVEPAQQHPLFSDRLPGVHGGAGRGGGGRAVPDPQPDPSRHAHPRRYIRSRDGFRLGVNIRILRNLNFGLGIYLAGLAGVLAAGMLGLQPTIGSNLIMPSFVAIIIGGLGSLPGTLLGGLLIGVASGITTVFFPSASEAVIYVLMGLVLLVRPRGLLGEEGRF